ncbi:MAG: YraN family protein [Planctomycetota bacterium]
MNFGFTRKWPNLHWPPWRSSDERQVLGRRGERAAAKFLRRRGHWILARNYRCLLGEIDLVCSDGTSLIFVEVKTRSDPHIPGLTDTGLQVQWSRVGRAAKFFLKDTGAQPRPCRFDLIIVFWESSQKPHIEHFPDAYHVSA